MKFAVEFDTKRFVNKIVKETEEDAFWASYDQQKKRIKTSIKNKDVGALFVIMEQGRPNTITVRSVIKLAKYTSSIHAVITQARGSKSIIMPIAAFVNLHVNKIVGAHFFRKAIEHLPCKSEKMQISSILYTQSSKNLSLIYQHDQNRWLCVFQESIIQKTAEKQKQKSQNSVTWQFCHLLKFANAEKMYKVHRYFYQNQWGDHESNTT